MQQKRTRTILSKICLNFLMYKEFSEIDILISYVFTFGPNKINTL